MRGEERGMSKRVLVGYATRTGSTTGVAEAIGWGESNGTVLRDIPTAAFCVHSMDGGSDEKQTRKRLACLETVRAAVQPVAEGFFLGKGPSADDSSLISRCTFKAFGGTGEGDSRDWDAIKGWAEALEL